MLSWEWRVQLRASFATRNGKSGRKAGSRNFGYVKMDNEVEGVYKN
jgi:hypothetical protein